MITFCFLIKLLLLLRNGGVSAHSSTSEKAVGQNVIVSMKGSINPIIDSVDETDLGRDKLATILTQKLKTFSRKSQSEVVSMLEKSGKDFQSYWISNQIFIKGASRELISSLKSLPKVKSVAKEKLIKLDLAEHKLGKQPKGVEWHLEKMEVDKVWDKTKGEGIIVAIIDSGVRDTNQALKGNYIGSENYGWHDPILFTEEPEDFSGHGTHVMGILAGSRGIGAAPGSKWMACRAALDIFLYEHAIIACGQFYLCPSDPSGKENCTGVPHIINNSWGEGGGNQYLSELVNAWIKVGIKPFFAAGNDGPDCKSVASPADYDNVIAVGSTDINDRLHESSSRGPAIKSKSERNDQSVAIDGLFEGNFPIGESPIPTDTIKPDIVAPGVHINSAFSLTDKSYIQLSGTSMATPAAAGVAALLLSIQPNMTLNELKNFLYTTTDKEMLSKKDKNFLSNSEQCGDIPDDKFPNNLYGHGRINAYKAYKKLEEKIRAGERANKKVLKSS